MFVGNRGPIYGAGSFTQPITIIKELGQGGFATTYLVETDDGEQLAMKAIDTENLAKKGLSTNTVINEINTLISLSSEPNCYPYIACYHGYSRFKLHGKDVIAIFSDYVQGPTLTEYIDELLDKNPGPEYDKLKNHMIHLLEALVRVHDAGYAHRDIKPENIIYDTKNNRLVLIDFGVACMGRCLGIAGTHIWMPLELLYNPPESLNAAQSHDIWSLGIVFYELANLEFPFDITSIDKKEDTARALRGPLTPSHYPDNKINYVIDRMLSKNWRDRPTASSLLNYIKSW